MTTDTKKAFHPDAPANPRLDWTYRSIGTASLAPVEPACEDCQKPIPARDVRAYRAEAGDPGALPAVCADCAEFGALVSR